MYYVIIIIETLFWFYSIATLKVISATIKVTLATEEVITAT